MRDFLDFIQPSSVGYTEIRCIQDGKVDQTYWLDYDGASQYASNMNAYGWDVYYGVIKRLTKDGKSAAPLTPVLWADVDAKAYPGGKRDCLSAIVSYEVPPSVIVDSGHGYHAYWRLENPVLWEYAQIVMMGLARNIRGDHVYDISRILRVPDTLNYKDETPLPVRLIRFDTTRILRFGDFDKAHAAGMWYANPVQYHKTRPKPTAYDPEQPLPGWLHDLIEQGAPQGTRSEQSFKVVCELLRRGWGEDDIRGVFETQGIGEKYREKGAGGERWLDLTISKARREVR